MTSHNLSQRFSPADSLGAKDPASIYQYLIEVDDLDAAELFRPDVVGGHTLNIPGISRSWHPTGTTIGFIPSGTHDLVDVENAVTMEADRGLIDQRVKITLDKFFVHQYPGSGVHRVLCEFAGKHQLPGEAEEMRFALNTEARDGQAASVNGQPIFMGVTIGADGISFEGRTINVNSSADDDVLKALDSSVFKSGLALITAAQPALKPFTGLATSVVQSAANRSRNKQVHSFNIGLDFSATASSAKLRLGSYIVVQTEGADWNWQHYVWDCNGLILKHKQTEEALKANYMVFGISPYTSTATSTSARARKKSS
ncbi:hypothetical protein [Paraburkholderia tropica]|uniref:hypothetical protein n=1 Tax=Paraburkholderia tropica TaxID=92647 RepID=UPI001590D701|nr:hypothetical protein [Paraburkholderia tropica]